MHACTSYHGHESDPQVRGRRVGLAGGDVGEVPEGVVDERVAAPRAGEVGRLGRVPQERQLALCGHGRIRTG